MLLANNANNSELKLSLPKVTLSYALQLCLESQSGVHDVQMFC